MKRRSLAICDALESRVLFSLTPAQTVAADKAKLSADEANLSADRKSEAALLAGDRAQLESDLSVELAATTAQYKSDVAAGKLAITTDQTNGAATLKSDRATITADEKAVALDKSNPTAEAAALAKLASDRQILADDTADLKTTLANDRTNWAVIEKTDQSGITAVRKQATAVLIVDKHKITADVKSSATTLADDSKTIADDEVQLAKDELLLQLSNLVWSD